MEFSQCRMGFSRLRAEFSRVQDGLKSILRDVFSRRANTWHRTRKNVRMKNIHFAGILALEVGPVLAIDFLGSSPAFLPGHYGRTAFP